MRHIVSLFLSLGVLCVQNATGDDSVKPNIIFILSDDVAQGDLGCYGQKLIETPRLDQMAAEGTRYMQAYCGTSVCAPSRSSLVTGLHMGHCPIRANREIQPEGQMPMPEGTYTVAKLLKGQGYATACIGKWGMGMFHTSGSPLKVGFDHFFGYNCQRHAHSYFPPYLYNDDQRFQLPGNARGGRQTYAQNLIADEILRWVRENKDGPFFLFYAVTLPHGRFEIDDQGIYRDKDWTNLQKNYAAMITRLDSDVGRLFDLLKDLEIDQNTIVFFSGDNGSSFNPNSEIGRKFDQTMGGKLRGFKRGMYEGALRQAAMVRWPGKVPAGRVTNEPWAFWDFLPTAAELAGASLPSDVKTDGLSLVSFLKGGDAPQRDYFYWELHEGRSIQAIRIGDWKAVRNGPSAPIELYNLKTDVGETKDVSAQHPELVARAQSLMAAARVDDPNWPMKARRTRKKKP
jgi:arylsulfatase A-like enzyme